MISSSAFALGSQSKNSAPRPASFPPRRARLALLGLGLGLFLGGCSSDNASGTPAQTCPNLGGNWTVTEHCDASLVGNAFLVKQADCALSFGAPFDAFTGSVSNAGAIVVSGPQQCTGTATIHSIAMTCTPTPPPCQVTLSR